MVSLTTGGFGGCLADGSWEFAGYLRRDVVDPEGNVVQLLERG